MDHPTITEIERWGYPKEQDHRHVLTDEIGNEIYTGDEYYEFNDKIYLKEALGSITIEVLEDVGAELKRA